MQRRTRPELLLAFSALVVLLPYAPSLSGPFLIDDIPLIQDNPAVHGFEWMTRWFVEFFPRSETDVLVGHLDVQYFRPVVLGSYALNWTLSPQQPFLFHATNLVLHGLCTAFVFITLRRWLSGNTLAATSGALMYGLHPAQTETVSWISGRTDSLLMVSLTVLLWGSHLWARRRHLLWGWVLLIVGTIAAFCSKETAVVACACVTVQALCTPGPAHEVRRRELSVAGVLLGVSALYLVGRSVWLPFYPPRDASLPLLEHGELVLRAFGHYLRLLVFPVDLSMYQVPVRASDAGDGQAVVVGAAGLGLVVLGLAWFRKTKSPCLWGLLLFLCLLAPALQLVPQRTELLVAPRFLSVPLLAVGLMVGQAARWLWLLGRSKVALRVLRVVVPSVLVVCAWLSFQRSRAWGDGRLFFAEELKRNATSTSVLFRAARRDANDGQKLSAWRRAACAYALALHRGDTRAAAALFMTSTQVAEEVAYDGPQGELSHLSEFLRDVVEGHAATFSLAGQELVYSASDVERGLLAAHRPTLLIMQARVLARLGSPQSVIAAQGAVESCRQCSFAVTTAARTFLQVGRTDAATRLLQSPVAASLSVEEKTRLTGFAARLASLESGGTGPTAVRAELERALMFSRHARVVELAERHPELFSKSESLLVEAVARSALRAGRPELAQEVLRRGFFASESEDVFVALEKEWGRGEPPVETYLPGRCVAPGEIQGDGF